MTETKTMDLGQALKEKRREEHYFIGRFLREHGTVSQQERFDAGVLPGIEVLDAMRDHAFAPAGEFESFVPITDSDVMAQIGCQEGATIQYRSIKAPSLTHEQWMIIKVIKGRLPDAVITGLLHEARTGNRWGVVTRYGAMAVIQYGPFELRKEFSL